jgi:glycosyltransferase involved in cell wall biosynthesis
VMPSTAESFGLMALEAMACGTAVVVTEGTSLTEIVRTPSAGIAVPAGDAEALTRTIESLLADDARRSILGRRGREIVEAEHSHDAYFQRHVALYTSLLEGTPATRGIPA